MKISDTLTIAGLIDLADNTEKIMGVLPGIIDLAERHLIASIAGHIDLSAERPRENCEICKIHADDKAQLQTVKDIYNRIREIHFPERERIL